MENPIVEQEKKKGATLLAVTENICAEVSEFRGKIYVGIRQWYEKDGIWYRKKNGINVLVDEFNDIVSQMEEIVKFVIKELPTAQDGEEKY